MNTRLGISGMSLSALTPWLAGLSVLALLLMGSNLAAAQAGEEPDVARGMALDLRGEIVGKGADGTDNVSAVALDRDRGLLLIGADEGGQIQVFQRKEGRDPRYVTDERACIALYPAVDQDKHRCTEPLRGPEVDIEGIAWGKRFVYVVGSHSRARRRVEKFAAAGKRQSRKKNRKRLATVKIEPSREQLFRFRLDSNGRLKRGSLQVTSLRNLIANHPVLSLFQTIPSKENGIDIEGLAIDDAGRLYLGFRGPVLRGGYALVLRVEFDKGFEIDQKHTELLYVDLGGRGIRGMTEVDGGFLLLAGPMGSGPGSYQVWWWNGQDALPGKLSRKAREKGERKGRLDLLCEIPSPGGGRLGSTLSAGPAKAEGIAATGGDRRSFIIVYDGAYRGAATEYHCPE